MEIKLEKINDKGSLKIIEKEYQALKNTDLSEIDKKQYKSLFDELKSINRKLWDIENEKRLCEKKSDFGEKFIKVSRDVHFMNDNRAKLNQKLIRSLDQILKKLKNIRSIKLFRRADAKFHLQSKLGIKTSESSTFPKLFSNNSIQFFTCLGFFEKQPTWAVIIPPGFKILFKPFMFFAANLYKSHRHLRSTKTLSYFESLTFLILSKASPQKVFTLLFALISPQTFGRCF